MQHRVILVGCGNMSRTWLRYLHERDDVELLALVDLDPAAAAARAAELGIDVPHFPELDAALAGVAATLVCDTTIPEAHAAIASAAMHAGCDVLSEKPMAGSLAAARQTATLARELGRFYAIMQNRRYRADIRAVRAIVDSGVLGRLGILNADFYRAPHFGGFRDQMTSPLLLDMAIHTFDQARFITGANAQGVYCHEFNPSWSWYAHGASASAVFEMDAGLTFTYRGSWCAPGLDTSWESAWRLVGEHGSLTWDGTHAPRVELTDGSSCPPPAPYVGREGHPGCLDAMFAALAAGRAAETSYADNINSLAMVFGATTSAAAGARVPIDPPLPD